MLPHRKYWVYRLGIDNPKFTASTHLIDNCTGCHTGGNAATADRNLAHAGMQRIPGGNTCERCHADAVRLAANSLHVQPSGFADVLAGRGFDLDPVTGTTSLARFTKQCTKCHIHNAETPEQPACGHCHISVPNSAGGGLVAGHAMKRTPDTVNNCTACHGSRVKDEYFGQNDALYKRNRQYNAAYAAADPFNATTLVPDVHRSAGMGCQACHPQAEMHGVGGAIGIDRYGVAGTPECRSCHEADLGTQPQFHSALHLQALSCHVCHSQPYKQCFGCHTEETASGAGYFSTNATDPTRVARQVTTLPAGDALITFRVGNNPKYGTEPGAPKYAVLRHVPVDPDVFAYSGAIPGAPRVLGLIPGISSLPTWKYATPHNIVRSTAITKDPDGDGPLGQCSNCHSSRWSQFWLTDAVQDTFGWVPSPTTDAFYQFEVDANTSVVQTVRPTQTNQ